LDTLFDSLSWIYQGAVHKRCP